MNEFQRGAIKEILHNHSLSDLPICHDGTSASDRRIVWNVIQMTGPAVLVGDKVDLGWLAAVQERICLN